MPGTTAAFVALTSADVTTLFVKPVAALATALQPQVSTIFNSNETETRVPVVNLDAGAKWLNDLDEIIATDADIAELLVRPAKVAGLSIVSNELAADSSPQATSTVGDGLARSCASQVDAAFLQKLAAPAPHGLAWLTGHASVTAAADFNDGTDSFEEAVAVSEEAGGNITAFLVGPVDALALSTLRDTTTGSRRNLLQPDPTLPTRRQVAGRPLFTNRFLPPGTIWAVDSAKVVAVVRQNAEVVASQEAAFSRDATAIRATLRIGFAFPAPETLVKISRPIPTP